jgi:hypothetical protein
MAITSGHAQGAYSIGVKRSILGMKVINTQREHLGHIEDIILDARDSRVVYAILSFGGMLGMGDSHFAIPWEALTFDLSEKVAVLKIEKDRLKHAPGFDKDGWPDMADKAWHSAVYGHYGYKPYWEEDPGVTSQV